MKHYHFSKSDTSIAKLIAITLMLLHHLFGFTDRILPENMYQSLYMFRGQPIEAAICASFKVCVAFFLFLSGYGTYLSLRKSKSISKMIANRIFRFLKYIWQVMIIFVPIDFILGVTKVNLTSSWTIQYDFESIILRDPMGREKDVILETTGFAAADLTLDKPGIYTVAITRKAALNTSYKKNGKTITVKEDKTGKENIISSVYSQQFAKSIICAGGNFRDDIGHEFGQKLEIIPITNPYGIINNCGGLMKVKVLFEGKPIPFLKVWGMYEGYSSGDAASVMVSTNRDGEAEFRINHWGTWLLRTRYDRPAAGELADRVNNEHYFSSITFFVP